MEKRKIAVITGSRAEYGILKPLIQKIKNSENLRLILLMTGMHLLKKYGMTIEEIKKDGFKINGEIKMYEGAPRDRTYYGESLGRGIKDFVKLLSKIKPHIVVVFGDRLEPLAATLAAASLRIPISHIHGGDKTDSGHIDESIRHAITRFVHIHLAPTEKCKDRLIKGGEEPWRVYKVGALGLDSVLKTPLIKKNRIFQKLNLNLYQKTILCIFHPVHLEAEKMGEQMREIIAALKELKVQSLIIYPNNDAGTQDIIREIEKVRDLPFLKVSQNIFHSEYVNLLRYVNVLIGNSSSGIIEAPSLKLPAVNIGSRNVGREHGENVIYVDADKRKIMKAIRKALYDSRFLIRVKQCKNPWGDGKTSGRIIKILSKIKLDKKLLQKKITY